MDTALRHRVNAARVAVRGQVDFFNQMHGQVASEWKADETRVTFADFAISEKLFAELRRSFPDDLLLSEESVAMDESVPLDSRYAWLLDPIDGTNNYALGMAGSAISLALLKEGQPVYGLVYDGALKQLLEGGPGQPLLVNGRRHGAPARHPEARAGIVALHFPLPAGRSSQLAGLLESYRVRSLGSAALHLAYVALGRLDGVLDERVRPWDIAGAACLLAASGMELRYLGTSPFPLRRFSMQDPFIRYCAGTPGFLRCMENWLG